MTDTNTEKDDIKRRTAELRQLAQIQLAARAAIIRDRQEREKAVRKLIEKIVDEADDKPARA